MFDWKDFICKDREMGVVCENEDEVNQLCKMFEERKIKWNNKESYAKNNGLNALKTYYDDGNIFPCVYYSDRTIGVLYEHKEEFGELFTFKEINGCELELI